MNSTLPILYSFRRCPYAIRARMALKSAEIELEHREILLKNKPPSMLQASAKGTVPVLVLPDNNVVDESWQIALWALQQNDPEQLLGDEQQFLSATEHLEHRLETEFKPSLDCYKYADRHPLTAEEYRSQAMPFLRDLECALQYQSFLLADKITFADIMMMPFIRQFAGVNPSWFNQSGMPRLVIWLEKMVNSDRFYLIMEKHPLWQFETKVA